MLKENLGVNEFVSEMKRVENYPDLETLIGPRNSAWSTGVYTVGPH